MERYFDRGQAGYAAPRTIRIFSNLAWTLLLELWSRRLGVAPAGGSER